MDVRLWSHLDGGNIRTFRKVPAPVADRMLDEHKKLLGDPFVTYYRVTLEDPDRGGYVVRDTDREVLGIGVRPANDESARVPTHGQLAPGTGVPERR